MFIEYQLLSLFNFAFMCQENVHARNRLKFISEFVNVKNRKKDFMLYNLKVHMFRPTNIYPLKVPNP